MSFLSGRDFLQSSKLKINALSIRSRTTRGKPLNRGCRTECHAETLINYIIFYNNATRRTHEDQIKRHNSLVSFVGRGLSRDMV